MADIFDLFRKLETERTPPLPLTHMVVGLGNPGKQYEMTRHNVGFDMLLALADLHNVSVQSARFHALTGEATIGGVRALLMMPQTFMNLSGTAVKEAASFFRIPPENILVLCDDISFEPGRFRLRRTGSSGGHNGLKSIIENLGTDAFPRLKIGVGKKPTPDYDLADWVLGKLSVDDRAQIRAHVPEALEACRLVLGGKFEAAQTALSAPSKGGSPS